ETGHLEQLALRRGQAGQRQLGAVREALVEPDQYAEPHGIHIGEAREIEDVAGVAPVEKFNQGPLELGSGGHVQITLDADDARALVGLSVGDRERGGAQLLGGGIERASHVERIFGCPRKSVTGQGRARRMFVYRTFVEFGFRPRVVRPEPERAPRSRPTAPAADSRRGPTASY